LNKLLTFLLSCKKETFQGKGVILLIPKPPVTLVGSYQRLLTLGNRKKISICPISGIRVGR
jgi:hypothetical protein